MPDNDQTEAIVEFIVICCQLLCVCCLKCAEEGTSNREEANNRLNDPPYSPPVQTQQPINSQPNRYQFSGYSPSPTPVPSAPPERQPFTEAASAPPPSYEEATSTTKHTL